MSKRSSESPKKSKPSSKKRKSKENQPPDVAEQVENAPEKKKAKRQSADSPRQSSQNNTVGFFTPVQILVPPAPNPFEDALQLGGYSEFQILSVKRQQGDEGIKAMALNHEYMTQLGFSKRLIYQIALLRSPDFYQQFKEILNKTNKETLFHEKYEKMLQEQIKIINDTKLRFLGFDEASLKHMKKEVKNLITAHEHLLFDELYLKAGDIQVLIIRPGGTDNLRAVIENAAYFKNFHQFVTAQDILDLCPEGYYKQQVTLLRMGFSKNAVKQLKTLCNADMLDTLVEDCRFVNRTFDLKPSQIMELVSRKGGLDNLEAVVEHADRLKQDFVTGDEIVNLFPEGNYKSQLKDLSVSDLVRHIYRK